MSSNSVAEQRLYIERLKVDPALAGGRTHDGLPDDEILERDEDEQIRPYIVVTFGTVYPDFADRSIAGETQQPHILPGTVECWGINADVCRALAGAVIDRLLGYKPNDNSSETRLYGGGSFTQKDSAGRPTRFMRAVNFETTINMAVAV